MNEYELIGRFADLDSRLRKIEGREPIQEPPAPAPVPLCEAVNAVLDEWAEMVWSDKMIALRDSLAAEVKRQEAIRELIAEYRSNHFMNCTCRACEKYRALDALYRLDRGRQ